MPDPATVSVIIPVYNGERFLAEAIESALGQTLKPLEIIVVDDGSTDRSAEVAASFSAVTLVSIPHRGVSAARNIGVAASSGELIAFLDADDTWREDKLELQVRLLNESPLTGIVMAHQTYRFQIEPPHWFRGPTDGSAEPGFMPSNWLFPRSTWATVGVFDPARTHSEDTDWLARARDAGIAVAIVDHPLVVHRIHDRNASGSAADVRQGVLSALRASVQRKREAQVP